MLTRAGFAQEFAAASASLRVVAIAQVGRDHADDVVQQAAVVAWARRDRFEPGTDFRAWLSAIVRGVARNERRGERRRTVRHRKLGELQPRLGMHESGAQEMGVSGAGVGVSDRALDDTLNRLSEPQRACLLLRVVLGHSYEEIALITDVPEATARSHVRRARLRMAEWLGESPAQAQAQMQTQGRRGRGVDDA